MHNKTVKQRVNKKKGGSPKGNTRTKRKYSLPPINPSLQKKANQIKSEDVNMFGLYGLLQNQKKQRISNSIINSNYSKDQDESKDSKDQDESNDSKDQDESNDSEYEEGPEKKSKYISDEGEHYTKANYILNPQYVITNDLPKPQPPHKKFSAPKSLKNELNYKSTGDSKKRKVTRDRIEQSKDDIDILVKKCLPDRRVSFPNISRRFVNPKNVILKASKSLKNELNYKSTGDSKKRKVTRDRIEQSKDDIDILVKKYLPDRRVTRNLGSFPNISRRFVNPKNVILKASKSSLPPTPPQEKKLPERIVALRLYNYYRDKSIENNTENPNHYLDYICHIRCKKGFRYTIDSDIERTIISNGPVEFDFSYRCQHVPASIKRENERKICSCDFEVNADYFKNLNNMTHRPKDEKTEYLKFVNSLTKEEDIYEFFLLLGNVIEFLTDEESCNTTNVTYLDEEINKQATVDYNYYQIMDEDHASIFKEKDVFKSVSFNVNLRYK
jgi:hypothetical protein